MLEHWTGNTGDYCESHRSEVADDVTPAYERLIAAAGTFATPAPLRDPDDRWRLEVLAHPHGPRVLQARILAPDGQPAATLAVAEGGGAGPRRAWRETVAAAPWFIDGCDPGDFRDPPDGPWMMAALLPALADHLEALEWLGAVEQYIGWAFLDSLQPVANA